MSRAAVASGVTLAAVLAALTVAAVPAEGDDQELRPLDIVILVDESGSLTEDDVAAEINATSTLAQGALSPDTRVSVVSFGSDNGEPGQEAATVRCEPTVVGEDGGRQYLADCVGDIRRRAPEEGHDTDHAAALGRALSLMDSGEPPTDAARVIFLLTDGALDVENSPQYGEPGDRDEAALREIDQHLATASDTRVQIWPLGFGAEIDRPQLEAFAAGGFQEPCNDLETATPHARVVEDSSDVVRALRDAYVAATCTAIGEEDSEVIIGGESATLTVDIPVIATDGAILVTKNNPAISVEYHDPNGEVVPSSGEHDQSVVQRSGENSTVEALQIRDPRPGEWTVRLSSPPGAEEELVTAIAQWQGAISARLTVDGTGRPGEEVLVRVTLWTRRTIIDDPDALAGLDFSVTAEGTGVDRHELGLEPDPDVPGQFTARFTVPDVEGTLTFTSRVQGEGVAADERVFHYEVSAAGNALLASFDLDPRDQIWAGEPLTGTVTVTNNSGSDTDVRMALTNVEDVALTVDPPVVEVPSGGQHEFDVAVHAGADTPPGEATVEIVAVSATDQVIGTSQPFPLTVRDAPGPLERYWWAWTLLLLTLAGTVVLGLLQRARWRERMDVRGLRVELYRDGERAGPELSAPSWRATEFLFTIHEEDSPSPRLDHAATSGREVYTVRRTPSGGAELRTPDGTRYPLQPGATGAEAPGPSDLTVRVYDEPGQSDTPPSNDALSGAIPGPDMDDPPESGRGYQQGNLSW